MRTIDDILRISPKEFNGAALELFRVQAERCEPYRRFMQLTEVKQSEVVRAAQIPYLPIELFKTQRVYCGTSAPEKVFTSSNTGGTECSRHYMERLADYEKTFKACFEYFYGAVSEWSFYGLLPSYLEREGSSLVYMVEGLMRDGRGGGFYLHNTDELLRDLRKDNGKKMLIGVTYALLDLAELEPDLSDTTVVETGGMKGKRAEMSKAELHKVLCKAFNTESIHSEYGMAELTSQAYSVGDGLFRCPPSMRVVVRDANNPLAVRDTGRGALNIIDLANRSSVAFIATQDLGEVYDDGSFRLLGRMAHSDVRGCNLLVQ